MEHDPLCKSRWILKDGAWIQCITASYRMFLSILEYVFNSVFHSLMRRMTSSSIHFSRCVTNKFSFKFFLCLFVLSLCVCVFGNDEQKCYRMMRMGQSSGFLLVLKCLFLSFLGACNFLRRFHCSSFFSEIVCRVFLKLRKKSEEAMGTIFLWTRENAFNNMILYFYFFAEQFFLWLLALQIKKVSEDGLPYWSSKWFFVLKEFFCLVCFKFIKNTKKSYFSIPKNFPSSPLFSARVRKFWPVQPPQNFSRRNVNGKTDRKFHKKIFSREKIEFLCSILIWKNNFLWKNISKSLIFSMQRRGDKFFLLQELFAN